MSNILKILQVGQLLNLLRPGGNSVGLPLIKTFYVNLILLKDIPTPGPFFLSFLFNLISYFPSSFRSTAKLNRSSDSPHIPCCNEPTLTHHYHPESTGVTLDGVHCMSFDMCINYHSIMQNSFTALKIFCAPLIHTFLSLSLSLWQPLIFLLSLLW
jgi:hypothetical protein